MQESPVAAALVADKDRKNVVTSSSEEYKNVRGGSSLGKGKCRVENFCLFVAKSMRSVGEIVVSGLLCGFLSVVDSVLIVLNSLLQYYYWEIWLLV